jgi:hypothetical protein
LAKADPLNGLALGFDEGIIVGENAIKTFVDG